MRNYYESGSWNVICDRCGLKKKNHMLRKEWTGLMVCSDTCWEPRHEQTLIQVPTDNPNVPWARPEGATIFVSTPGTVLTQNGTFSGGNVGPIITTQSGAPIETGS